MKKLFILILLCSQAYAASWVANACNAGNISTCDWRPTSTASCTGTGTALVWANRAAGDVFAANGCTGIVINVDPGVGGSPVTLNNCVASACGNAANSAIAGGNFVLSTASVTATVNVTAGGVAPTGNGTVQITGSNTGMAIGCTACTFTGGSVANAQAIADTHTTSTVVVTGFAVGGSNGSANGYALTSASGIVDGGATSGKLNCFGGSQAAGCNLGSTAGAVMSINNCIGTDTSSGPVGCIASAASTAPFINLVGSCISGRYSVCGSGRIYPTPATTASSVYMAANATYISTNIVDSGGNLLAAGSQVLTNALVFPFAFATNGIGTGCSGGITACSNVKNGITFGPYTGNVNSSAQNSGSAN